MVKKATRKEDEPSTSGPGGHLSKQTKTKGAKEPALPMTRSTLVRAAKTKAMLSMSNPSNDKNYIKIDVEKPIKVKAQAKAALKKSISTDNLLSVNVPRRLRRSKSADHVSHEGAAPSAKGKKETVLTKARTKKAGTEPTGDEEKKSKRRTAKKAETEVAPGTTTKSVARGRARALSEPPVAKPARGRGGKAAGKDQSSALATKAKAQTSKKLASNRPWSRKAAPTANPQVEPDQQGVDEPTQKENARLDDDVQLVGDLISRI